ncbi:hypothetical protein [Methylococcus mesophilus]|uniref:hypothetical protein n=1 Tax=Methylococcus mesophilus TaxID=2993564 RepID=UPI00224B9D88|nr:hypothetical protein [Methylococcus mesophilus]UZR29059.1 hypothetical protein OOT43_00100 [Methylococcus mesophilus]
MRHGKRIHRISISIDDETFQVLAHKAAYDDRALGEYIARLVQQQVHGLKATLPKPNADVTLNGCCDE